MTTTTHRELEGSLHIGSKGDVLPSDFFHTNVFLGFQEDGLGIRDRHIIGVENLQLGVGLPPHGVNLPQEPGDP